MTVDRKIIDHAHMKRANASYTRTLWALRKLFGWPVNGYTRGSNAGVIHW